MTQFTLEDGRSIEILDNGVASPDTLVFHHGTPSDVTLWRSWLDLAANREIRALAYSRAGYGKSSRCIGRSVLSVADDIRQILDAKGISKFVPIGWSGGGPHALALAFDRRCRGIIVLAGVAQFGAPDLDFLEGMGPENHDEFGAALKGEAALSDWMERNATALRNITGEQLREALGGLVGPADKATLQVHYAEEMAGVMRSALALSFDGWIDDDLAFVRDWGFAPKDISVPVKIWQGDQDLMVPAAHGRWLAKQIPGSELAFIPDHGHISLVVHYRDAILEQARQILQGD